MKPILFPFSKLYGWSTALRNYFFDKGWHKSVEFELPVIGVGNLCAGGAGKTPHVMYLLKELAGDFQVGMLSRGYKRLSKGFVLANSESTAIDIGDEPLQIYRKFPKVVTAVCESRAFGIPAMLMEHPDLEVVVLDDNFQHRQVKVGLQLLLTEYDRPFTQDHLLPLGRLREDPEAYQRADVIIITKCPHELSREERSQWEEEIRPFPHQQLLFSQINYHDLCGLNSHLEQQVLHKDLEVLLVCGIARTQVIQEYLETKVKKVHTRYFGDHHLFSKGNLVQIKKQFDTMETSQKCIITTEKDAMRFLLHQDWIETEQLPLYYLPIEVRFQGTDAQILRQLVGSYIRK